MPVAGGRSDDGGTEGRCKAEACGLGGSIAAADFSGMAAASLELLLGVATVGFALVDAGTSGASQAESRSSVLEVAGGAVACDLLNVDDSGVASCRESGFDASLGAADCSELAGFTGLGR